MKRIFAVVAVTILALGFSWTSSANATALNEGKLKITLLGFNAHGTDVSSNRNEEYVKLTNVSGAALDVTGWTVSDSVGNDTELTDAALGHLVGGVLPNGHHVIVYSGFGSDTVVNSTHAIYRNGGHYLNNAGDTVTVKDDADGFVDRLAYDDFGINPTP